MVDYLDDDYQQIVVEGALAQAKDSGAHLLCFLVGKLQPDLPDAPVHGVYRLIHADSVDALIILGGALVNTAGAAALERFVERYRGLPMVSIATHVLEGVPTVAVDNHGGMRRGVLHLCKDHGLSALAFVCGPEQNEEARLRLAIFRKVLAENAIAVREELILPGDFSPASGAAAIQTLFGERGVKPEEVQGIVFANDTMAMGALGELTRRGIRVPDQVAVVGFDDVDDVRYTNPPLTSVYQPLRDQGREAVRLALAALRGESVADVSLRTELVARRSCGCYPHQINAAHAAQPGLSFDAALIERRQVVLAELARTAQGRFGALAPQWEVRLVNAFADSARGDTARLLQVADDMVRQLGDAGADLNAFHEVLSVLRRELLPCLSGDAKRRNATEALLDEVRRLAAQASERREARGRLHALRHGAEFLQRAASLAASFEPGFLHEQALPALRPLGIRSALVARYTSEGPQLAEVVASTYQGVPLGHRGKSRDLLRQLAAGSAGHCVTSLYYGDGLLGFAVFELGARTGFGYEALRSLVSTALEGQRLRQRLRELEAAEPAR